MVMSGEQQPRKPGRPRAISKSFESVVATMYDEGDGYRAIARTGCVNQSMALILIIHPFAGLSSGWARFWESDQV